MKLFVIVVETAQLYVKEHLKRTQVRVETCANKVPIRNFITLVIGGCVCKKIINENFTILPISWLDSNSLLTSPKLWKRTTTYVCR
jgi:hypothetical protein